MKNNKKHANFYFLGYDPHRQTIQWVEENFVSCEIKTRVNKLTGKTELQFTGETRKEGDTRKTRFYERKTDVDNENDD